MLSPEMLVTWQFMWVQVEEKALNSPAFGWVTTTFSSAMITPPPTGTSAVDVSASAPPAGGELDAVVGSELAADVDAAGVSASLPPPHAAMTPTAPTATAAPRPDRRLVLAGASGAPGCSVCMTSVFRLMERTTRSARQQFRNDLVRFRGPAAGSHRARWRPVSSRPARPDRGTPAHRGPSARRSHRRWPPARDRKSVV